MSSKDEFIIRRSDSTTVIFRKWDEFITAAKAAKLIDIFNGKTSVKSDEEVEADNKSRLSYLKTALIKQTLIQEGINRYHCCRPQLSNRRGMCNISF